MASVWDDEDIKSSATGGDFFKFVAVGDAVRGVIAHLGKKMFGDQAAVEIRLDDGMTVTAGQVALIRALYELQPGVGDEITIEFVATYKTANGTGKLFRVDVTDAEGETRSVDQSTNDQRPKGDEPPKRGTRNGSGRAKASDRTRTKAKAGASTGGTDEPPY